MNESGLIVDIYRNAHGDCTAGALSSTENRALLILPEGGPFSIEDNLCKLVLRLDDRKDMSRRFGKPCPIVVPVDVDKNGGCNMFGGNFVYTSDSRFPYGFPIPIHDRVEHSR